MTSIRTNIFGSVLGIISVGMPSISAVSYRNASHEVKELFDAQPTHPLELLSNLVYEIFIKRRPDLIY